MHFAICLWGIVRSLRYTVDSLREFCLDPITDAGHTYEIYMHTYRFSGAYTGVRSGEVGVQMNFSEWNLATPDHVYVEDQDLFDQHVNYTAYQTWGDPWENNYESFTNHIRAMNSLFYLSTIVEKESRYKEIDGVVFLRPDVTYLNELPYYLLEHFQHTLFLADFHRSCKGGEYNDRFAMGDLKSAITYAKRFENALEYSTRKPLHSETYTYDYLTEHNVSVVEVPFRFKRTRANGEFHVRDETAVVSPRQQPPEQEYTTTMALRMVYTVLEEVTNHKVYIWNHDDNENLYCKPHPYLSFEDCLEYRRRSRRNRVKREQMRLGGSANYTSYDSEEAEYPRGELFDSERTAFAHTPTGQRAEVSGVMLSNGQRGGRLHQRPGLGGRVPGAGVRYRGDRTGAWPQQITGPQLRGSRPVRERRFRDRAQWEETGAGQPEHGATQGMMRRIIERISSEGDHVGVSRVQGGSNSDNIAHSGGDTPGNTDSVVTLMEVGEQRAHLRGVESNLEVAAQSRMDSGVANSETAAAAVQGGVNRPRRRKNRRRSGAGPRDGASLRPQR
jgi:hypothetical protein